MLKLTQELMGIEDDDLNPAPMSGEQNIDANATLVMMRYFDALTQEKRRNPSEDLASVIANGRVNNEPLPDMATLGYYITIATAGHDTTSSSTSGAVWALAEHPEELQKVRTDLSLIPRLIEEVVRWVTPVKHFMRTVIEDTTISGQKLFKGEWLMLCYASGNRDERVYDGADSFRINRAPQQSVAFGYGAHLCLRQALAKMEMRIFFEELIPRLKWLELDGDGAAMSKATFINGPKTLPVRFEIV